MTHRQSHISATSSTAFHSLRPLKVNTSVVRKSAEQLTLADLTHGLPSAVLPFGDAAKGMIEAAFQGTSRNATANAAADFLGSSPDTLTRILGGDTAKIDGGLMMQGLVAFQKEFDSPCPIGGGLGIAIVVMQ